MRSYFSFFFGAGGGGEELCSGFDASWYDWYRVVPKNKTVGRPGGEKHEGRRRRKKKKKKKKRGFDLQGLAATSELGHADTMALATEPMIPVPGASVEARETMMCAPPEEGTQVTLSQAEDSRWTTISASAAGIMKPWPTVASEMKAADVFILEIVVVVAAVLVTGLNRLGSRV